MGAGPKPKWTRWRTFKRPAEELDAHVERSMLAVAVRFGIFDRFS
jgi:hypothetical protein